MFIMPCGVGTSLNQTPQGQNGLEGPQDKIEGQRQSGVQASLGSKCPQGHTWAWATGAARGPIHEE